MLFEIGIILLSVLVLALVFIACVLGSAMGLMVYGYFRDISFNKRITLLEKTQLSAVNSEKGKTSWEVRQKQAEEFESAVAELVLNIQGGKDIKDAIKETAIAHPNAVMNFAKKFKIRL